MTVIFGCPPQVLSSKRKIRNLHFKGAEVCEINYLNLDAVLAVSKMAESFSGFNKTDTCTSPYLPVMTFHFLTRWPS